MESKELKIKLSDNTEKTLVIHEFLSPEFDEVMKIEDNVDRITKMIKLCSDLSDDEYNKLTIRERSKITEIMNELNGWNEDFQEAQETELKD